MIGAAGYIDRFSSSADTFPTIYTLHVDVGRFISSRIVIRGGLAGTASVGAEENLTTGT